MKITPQDIIDREFRVKFRGFDMAEVDTFLEEVAESFFKLNEENILLNEKILALQQDLETKGSMVHQGQVEFPPELGNILEDLKQDSATISAELGALKQDRQTFDSLRDNLEKVLASLNESCAVMTSEPRVEFPLDLANTLDELKQGSKELAAELAALQEGRQAVDSLKKSLEEIIGSTREAAASMAPGQGHAAIPADLGKTLEDFKQGTESLGAELAALKQEVGTLSGIRAEINRELQELLNSRFDALEAKLSSGRGAGGFTALKADAAAPAYEKKEKLPAARIEKKPDKYEEDTRLPEYEEQDDGSDDSNLEFLSEDDILDVDKLRGIFQSVLDDGLSDAHVSREGDDVSADLLFLEEDFIEDDHEPAVTYGLDENETDNKEKPRKP